MSLHLRLPDGRFAPAALAPVTNPDGSITVQAVQVGDPFDPCPAAPPPEPPMTTLGAMVAALTPEGGTLTLSGVYTEDLDLRGITGPVVVEGPATVGTIYTDGPHRVTLKNLTATAILALRGTWVEFAGAITVQGWTRFGVQGDGGVRFRWAEAGSLTIIGPGKTTNSWGLHLVDGSSYTDFHSATALTTDECGIGVQLGFNSSFSVQGPGSVTVLEDCGKGIQATDNSNWSTNKPLTYRRCTSQRDINSMSYYEAVGGVTVQ